MNRRLIFVGVFFVTVMTLFFLDDANSSPIGNIIAQTEEQQEIVIPVTVHLIRDEQGAYTSSRNEENIRKVFDEANRIWSQANLRFEITQIKETHVSTNAIPSALNGNYNELFSNEQFDQERINVFFAQSLNGINGLALTSAHLALVADHTTVNDYRTTAHEFGHLFGLKHVQP